MKLQTIRHKQDEERRKLLELRTLLRSSPDFERVENVPTDKGAIGYSLHQLQGDKNHGITRSGHLLKKSEGKVRRVWQKRRCRVTADGFLDICHADETKAPTRVNLLTCQIKPVSDDKKGFDLISCKYSRGIWSSACCCINCVSLPRPQITDRTTSKRRTKPTRRLGCRC